MTRSAKNHGDYDGSRRDRIENAAIGRSSLRIESRAIVLKCTFSVRMLEEFRSNSSSPHGSSLA
jgi:hypothetical protein